MGSDELGSGRLRLEQRERLAECLLPARVAQTAEHERERGQHPPGGDALALFPVAGERLLERFLCLLQPVLLLGGLLPSARAGTRARDGRRG